METIYVETDEKQALLKLPGISAKGAGGEIAWVMDGKSVLKAGLKLSRFGSFPVFIGWVSHHRDSIFSAPGLNYLNALDKWPK